jgi:hypothetical protein
MSSDEVAATAVKMAEAWNGRDLDQFLQFLTDDVVWTDPAMQTPARGKVAVERFARSVLRAFPDFEYTIRPPVCIADDRSRCAVPWRIAATHCDYLDPPGFAPTNRQAVFDGVDLLEFRGSQVCRIETLFDVVAPAEQLLGMRLRPAPGGVREKLTVVLQRVYAFALRSRKRPIPARHSRNKPAG